MENFVKYAKVGTLCPEVREPPKGFQRRVRMEWFVFRCPCWMAGVNWKRPRWTPSQNLQQQHRKPMFRAPPDGRPSQREFLGWLSQDGPVVGVPFPQELMPLPEGAVKRPPHSPDSPNKERTLSGSGQLQSHGS